MKILEEFRYGNIQPREKAIPQGSRHAKLLNLLVQNENDLTALLSDEAKDCSTNSKMPKMNCPA